MFANFFVRTSLDLLEKESVFLLEHKINPEIYIESRDLEQLGKQEMKETTRLVVKFAANTIHAPFLDIFPGSFDNEQTESSLNKLIKVFEIAVAWKSQLVVMHFNYDPVYATDLFDLWLDNTTSFLKRLLQESEGITIALENISEPTPAIVAKIKEKVNSSRIIDCFDLGHHNIFAVIPFEKWLDLLKLDHRIHFHFHDNWGEFDDHLALEEGNIDWQRVKKVISGLDIEFSVTLEPHSKDTMIKTVKNYRKIFLNELDNENGWKI